jgi:pimeloyl-ACP methyl ester carboxylesterase
MKNFVSERIPIDDLIVNVHAYQNDNLHQVVLVHGIGVSSRYFRRLAGELAKTYRVYVLDLPGYGTTPKPKRPLSVAELGDVVNRVIQKINIVDPALIGHSMGCQIIAQAERRQPGYKGLVMISPTINKDERSLPLQAWRLFCDGFKEPPTTNAAIFQDYLRMGPIRYLRTTRLMLEDAIEVSLEHIKAPVLFMRGTRDGIAPRPWIDFLKSITTRSQTVEIQGAAHAMHHTHVPEVAQACRDFIGV